ncbi:MAG TPA: hypothetical protein VHB97_26475 [Polyangia bacterium]|jgi:hypothetical protein|nr:hypothetical protein [Polyangia bacterium]
MDTIDFGEDAANPSGAPEAGGATSRGSRFGGDSLTAKFLRMVARVARDVEAEAYRRLRDLEHEAEALEGHPLPGAPKRTRNAFHHHEETRIH